MPSSVRIYVSVILLPLALLLRLNSSAQEYVNGNLITDSLLSNGSPAPTGTFWSQIQPPNVSNGTISGTDTRRSIIDDFIIPAGQFRKINRFDCYSYCTGYTGSVMPFDSLMIRIFKTDPRLPNSSPIWGDFQNNRLISGSFSKIYRVGTTFDTSRKIWEIRGLVDTTLGEGRYWIEWILGRISNAPVNAVPFSTLKNLPDIPGSNALIHDLANNSYIPITDQASGYNQDIHFKLQYADVFPSACSGLPNPGKTTAELKYACPDQRFRLSVAKDPLISGLSYTWQLSTDSLNWSTISGYDDFYLDTSQSAASFYRCIVHCGNNAGISIPVKVNMQGFGFLSQPANLTASCGEVAGLKYDINSTSPISKFQWQWKDTSGIWSDISNSFVISGSNSNELRLLKVDDSLNFRQFRLTIQNICGDQLVGNPASLQVIGKQNKISPDSLVICESLGRLEMTDFSAFLDSFSSTISGSGKLIRDTLKTGVTDTIKSISIPAGAEITGISVRLNIRHSYIGDLSINLKSPNGKVINLINYLNGSGGSASPNGFVNTIISSHGSKAISESTDPYTDFFKADLADPINNPDYPIGPSQMPPNTSTWNDLLDSVNGNWILGVYDGFTGDFGRLDKWALIFTYSKPNEATWTTNLTGSLYKDSAGIDPLGASEAARIVYVKPMSTGYYVATLNHPDCSGLTSDTAYVIVKGITAPIFSQIPDICSGDSLVLPAISQNGIRGYWSPAVNNKKTTTYTFTPDADSGNCILPATMTVVVSDCEKNNVLSIYPNPAKGGVLNVNIPEDSKNGHLFLFDGKGAKIIDIQCKGRDYLNINVEKLSPGVYLVFLLDEKGRKKATAKAIIL